MASVGVSPAARLADARLPSSSADIRLTPSLLKAPRATGNSHRGMSTCGPGVKSMKNRLETVLAQIHGPRVLDLGCGGGPPGAMPGMHYRGWLHGAIRRTYPEVDVWGVELDATKAEAMSTAGFRNIVVGSADDFQLDQRFDTVVAGEVIEHVNNPSGLLSSARLHLSDGGRLVISTPYPFGLPHILYAWLKYPKTCSNGEHVTWFCPTTLSELAERHGFRVESWTLAADAPPAPGRLYRVARPFYLALHRVLPARAMATSMVFVLKPT
jgi:SAM-dependent methyltransferase